MSFIEFDSVYRKYHTGEITIPAVDGVSFSIEKGEFCLIVGTSGAGKSTVLNILGPGDSFGILSVYSAEDFPTKIYATKNSEIAFFTGEQIVSFVNNYSHISQNLIRFLAGRISFLNKKIATFSPSRVSDRLAVFLLSERERQASDALTFNCQKTAEEIGAGRASVYRAIETLEAQSLIKASEKKILIIDREGLERIIK